MNKRRIDAIVPIGAVFGLWTVLGLAPRKSSREATRWLCRCKCGIERPVIAASIKKGQSKSCGETCPFEVPDGRKRKKHKDFTGLTFGYWTVLEQLPEKVNDRWLYLCRCKCGVERVVMANSLRTGHSKSCGCLRIEAISKKPFESIYNRLIYTADKRGQTVDLSYEEYLKFAEQKCCFYCGFEVSWVKVRAYKTAGKSEGTNLDRKNNALGYSVENCVVCCGECNRTKGDRYTYEEFLLLSPALKEIQRLRNLEKI